MSWKKVKLSELCNMNSGGTPSRAIKEYYIGDIPWAKISDIENAQSGIIKNTEEHISKAGLDSINNRIFPKGTLLLAMYGSVGKAAFTGIEMSTNQAILGIRIKDENTLDYSFLKYWFQTIKTQLLNRAVGGTLQNISLGIVKDLEIPLPPLSIQKRIAEILDAADALRRKDQELLRKYDELAQAIFIDMFGDPVKNEKGWEVKKLSDLFISGPRLGTITPVSVDGILPVVRVGELGNLNVAISQCKKVKLNDVEKKKYLLQINDILLARAIGSLDHLGKASLIQESNEEIVFDSHVMRLQFDQKKINSFFFYTWLQSKGGREIFLQNAGKTAVQFNINGNQISQIRINLPEISLQERFTEIVLFVQNQRMKVVIQKKNSDILFDSLLQQAFKGELVK